MASAFVAYEAALSSAVTLKQITQSTYNGNTGVIRQAASGATSDSLISGGPADPGGSFESGDVAGVVSSMSMTSGLYTTSDTIKIPFQKRAAGGLFAAGSSHFHVTGTNALFIPTSFSAGQSDDSATANIDYTFLSTDGSNPAATASSVAVGASSFNATHAFGAVVLNGVAIDTTAVTVNTGLTIESRRGHNNYPELLWIPSPVRPNISITVPDLSVFATQGSTYGTGTSLVVYFKHRSDGGQFVANGTATHISFTFATGITETTTVGGSAGQNADGTLTFHGKTLVASATSTHPA